MNRVQLSIIFLLTSLLFQSCYKQKGIITSAERKADIQRMLQEQKKLTLKSQLPTWNAFEKNLTIPEKEGLEFLLAYMPLSDLADYSPGFFLENVHFSLVARYEMPWAKNIPEELFLHDVLPVRIDRENLDQFRSVMYREIKDRISGKPMIEAAQEIAHLCQEKLEFKQGEQSLDSPLGAMRRSFGNRVTCSILTGYAMRTAAIPCRLVYPTSDSTQISPWLEIWIDGKWMTLDPCQKNFALHPSGINPISGTPCEGQTTIYGSCLASENALQKGDRYGKLLLPIRRTDLSIIESKPEYSEEKSDPQRLLKQVARQDSILRNYRQTFKDTSWIDHFAQKLNLSSDSCRRIILMSQGNWEQLVDYFEKNVNSHRRVVLEQAWQLADNDFATVTEVVLTDHLKQLFQAGVARLDLSPADFSKYVLSPKLENEWITPWRGFLSKAFGVQMANATRSDIRVLTDWIGKNIQLDSLANNPMNVPLTPTGVYQLRVADRHSVELFFIAACRTFGIPARMEATSNHPEYFQNGKWSTIDLITR